MSSTTEKQVRPIAYWRDESTMNPFEKIAKSHQTLPLRRLRRQKTDEELTQAEEPKE
jgi:hypothetical protein